MRQKKSISGLLWNVILYAPRSPTTEQTLHNFGKAWSAGRPCVSAQAPSAAWRKMLAGLICFSSDSSVNMRQRSPLQKGTPTSPTSNTRKTTPGCLSQRDDVVFVVGPAREPLLSHPSFPILRLPLQKNHGIPSSQNASKEGVLYITRLRTYRMYL